MEKQKSRGENAFKKLPKPAAKFYDYIMRSKPTQLQYEQIAKDLASLIRAGRVLDVGTGPGWLIQKLHEIVPEIELFGLDISKEMIAKAQTNLSTINVQLKTGSVYNTDFHDNFFDCVICSGSFYLWDKPVEGLNEIHRILKPGTSSFLYESLKGTDDGIILPLIRRNLRDESLIIRWIAPKLILRQMKMTYSMDELKKIINTSEFACNFTIEKIELVNIPIWARIQLKKCF